MFIKNKPITRIATLFLTLAMLFTTINITPLITHAADGVNGELAVTNKQNISGSGGWADIRQGYRFYIIDRTCTRQSDIYDFYYEVPAEVGVYYINTRWEPVTTYNGTQNYWHTYPISDLANTWCKGSINASDILNIPPMFITSKEARYVNGDEFQYWFIGTTSGDTPLNLPSGGNTSAGNTGGGSSQIGQGQNITERTPEEQQRIKEEQKQDALSKATTMSTVLNSFDNKISNCTSYYHNHYYEYFNKNKQRINNSISILKGIFASYATNGKELGLSDAEAKAYASHFVYNALAGGYPDNIKNWITCAIAYSACFDGNGKTYYTNDLNSSTGIHTLAKINLPQSKINSILPDPLLLNQNIPLAGATLYPADKMLGQANGIKVYNFNIDVTGDGSVTALDALRYEIDGIYQYYLVVEPIAWINVFIDGDHHEALRSYGSYYNLLNKYNEVGNDSASGMHASYIKELGKNSLVVKRDYTEMVYPVTKGTNSARMTVSQILSEIKGRNAGYGMQIYCGKDMDRSGTSTYDHSLGTTPGPAPDPTPLPEETELGTLSKQVTIIKNYVEIKDNAGTKTEVTIGNYVRHENPHTITIEDEPNYKVIDWQTSTKTPPTVTNGSKTPYSTITSNSTKTQAGTDPTTVTLTKTEKVLYVKLIKSDESLDIEDTPYTLTESQISKLATADNPAEGVELSTQSFTINHQSLNDSHTYEKEIHIPCTGATCNNKNYIGDYICKKSEHDCSTDHSCSGTAKNPCSRYHKHTNACKQWVCGGHGITIDYITHPMSLDDKLTTLKLAQTKTYSSLIAEGAFTKNSLSPDPRTTTTQYQDTLQGYEYNFIIQRGKDDKLNLYSGITNPKTSLSTPSKLYNFTASKAQKSSRASNDTKQYPITLDFQPDIANSDLSTSTKCSTCGHTHTTSATADSHYTPDTNIKIQTYAGLLNSTVVDTKVNPNTIITLSPFDGRPQTTGGKSYPSSGVMVQSPSTISFLPYIQMTYQTLL